MSFSLEPRNPEAGEPEFPNGFWEAFCVETPVSALIECEYTDRGTIRYEHDGYVGELWFTEEEALKMHQLASDFIQTDEYTNHRYFAERQNQMEQMLEFLKDCGGFRKGW